MDPLRELRLCAFKAMDYCKKAVDLVSKAKEVHASFFVAMASTEIAVAKTLYFAHEDLARNDVDDFFHRFDVFSQEFAENFFENHSHQWTSIEYDRLEEAYNDSALPFPSLEEPEP